ncbi:MAG: ABC transporter substrate-binding protein [bacterium]
MKKNRLFIITISIFLILLINFYNCKQNEVTSDGLINIKLAEVTHSIFYTPLYIALENGYFIEEGLNVEIILTSGADAVSSAILSGDVNIGLAGAESAIYIYEAGQKDYLQIFSGLTKRDGQFIVSRVENNEFDLVDLYDKEILIGRENGMPALNFMYSLYSLGIDDKKIDINTTVDFAALTGTFISGIGDYVNLFEPNASIIENEGYGKIVASVGQISGEVPYTTFYAKKSYLDNNKETLIKFTNAIAKALRYVNLTDSLIIANDIINQFPDQKVEDLSTMIENYKIYDCWLDNPFITYDSFNNLETFLIKYDLLSDYTNYENIVNNLYVN